LTHSKTGRDVWLEMNTRMLPVVDSACEILGVARDVTESRVATSRLRRMLDGTVRIASRISEVRDPYTAGHERRVTEVACAIGCQLDLTSDQLEGLRISALLHDIGKVAIPAEILARPGKLADHEFQLIKVHPKTAFELLQDIEFPWPVARIILQHHERMDGSGYPAGLKGDNIFLEARIIGVADTVEAMASHRPYRPALGVEAALDEIRSGSGVRYDANVVTACEEVLRSGEIKL